MNNVIFDLDGTLVDSLPGIEESARIAIAVALPDTPIPEIRPLIGPPIAAMFANLWPELKPQLMERLLAEFRAHYDDRGCLLSKPYPNVREVLIRLSKTGKRLFVLTNKPARPAQKLLAHIELESFFEEVMGPDSIMPAFRSKAEGARVLQMRHGLVAGETVLVGDGKDDAEAARACDFGFIAVAYGYGSVASQDGIQSISRINNFSEIEHVVL